MRKERKMIMIAVATIALLTGFATGFFAGGRDGR